MRISCMRENQAVLHQDIGSVEFEDGTAYDVSLLIPPVGVMFLNKQSRVRWSVSMTAISEAVREAELQSVEDPEEILP